MRARLRALMSSLSAEYLVAQSGAASARVLATAEWQRAMGVACFCSMEKEFQTSALIAAALAEGKAVYLPKVVEPRELVFRRAVSADAIASFPKSRWGIPEPPDGQEDLTAIDLVIVPGVAFDTRAARLGHGKGFYDTFFHRLRDHHHRRKNMASPENDDDDDDTHRNRKTTTMPPLFGVALDEQLILEQEDPLPTEPHDVFLDAVFAPSRTIHGGNRDEEE